METHLVAFDDFRPLRQLKSEQTLFVRNTTECVVVHPPTMTYHEVRTFFEYAKTFLCDSSSSSDGPWQSHLSASKQWSMQSQLTRHSARWSFDGTPRSLLEWQDGPS